MAAPHLYHVSRVISFWTYYTKVMTHRFRLLLRLLSLHLCVSNGGGRFTSTIYFLLELPAL